MGIPGITNSPTDDSHERGDILVPPILHRYLNITRDLRNYVVVMTLFFVLSYSVYLIFGDDTVIKLGKEDGVFEYLTAIFFLVASIFFIKIFISNRNGWFLLLALVLFIGCGEEISWGQRIFNVLTPDFMERVNVQKEINIHNLKILNARNNTGIAKLHSIVFLYKLFWLTYGVLLPIAVFHIRSIFSITEKVRLPIPPVPIGIFFLINWLTFKITMSFILPPLKDIHYYWTINEIMECGSAFVFMTLSIYFHNNRTLKSNYDLFQKEIG